jgi:CheY-like chemotaxis protein
MPESAGTSTDLPGAIELAIQHPAAQVGGKPVSVIAEYPVHLPTVQADPEVVVGLIASMLSAAIAFSQRGEVRVGARLVEVGEVPETYAQVAGSPDRLVGSGPWAVVSVLASAEIPFGLLQDRFNSAAVPASAVELPYGLSTCRVTAEGFGGQMWVETQPGAGSRFNIALPLRAARLSGADVSSLRRLVETRLPEGGEATKTLLLVVEDADVRALLLRDLVAAGYRVVAAGGGSDVHGLALAESPDLVLLDLLARDPTAFDAAMVLKQDPRTRNVPVLFLTSVDDPQAGFRMGAVNFLVRPVGTAALVSTIHAVLSADLSPSARVLVVEPNDATRETMILMIQSHGYRVTEARAPEEALVLAERVPPALALVNARLAQERDYWLSRGLRRVSESLQIFVMAEVLTEAEGRAAIRRGASGFSQTDKLPDLLDRVRGQRPKT